MVTPVIRDPVGEVDVWERTDQIAGWQFLNWRV